MRDESAVEIIATLIVVIAVIIATLVIFHGDVRCLVVDCVIVKETPHAVP